jgi:hypothetical protein
MGSAVRRRYRNRAQRLRLAVEALPPRTCEAMLKAIGSTPIVAGAYVDRESGGVCPMLAAHRNGGRTNLASFARAWDRYTGAKRPRLATRRELRTLRALLVSSLAGAQSGVPGSIAEAATRIRAEREAQARRRGREASPATETGERLAARDLARQPWTLPASRRLDIGDLLAEAERQLADRGAFERRLAGPGATQPLTERSAAHLR